MVCSAIQYAQRNILSSELPPLDSFKEMDLTYELACAIALSNNTLTHNDYLQMFSTEGKKQNIEPLGYMLNIYHNTLYGVPIANNDNFLELYTDPRPDSLQDPESIMYQFILDQSPDVNHLDEKQLALLFPYVDQLTNYDIKVSAVDAIKNTIGENQFNELHNKHCVDFLSQYTLSQQETVEKYTPLLNRCNELEYEFFDLNLDER